MTIHEKLASAVGVLTVRRNEVERAERIGTNGNGSGNASKTIGELRRLLAKLEREIG